MSPMASPDVLGVPESPANEWPKSVRFSMAPFGYVVDARRVEINDNEGHFCCQKCTYRIPYDRRRDAWAPIQNRMRQHIDFAH